MPALQRIYFLVHNNQYDSKRHFTAKLIEALERRGVECFLIDTPHGELEPHHFEQIKAEQPDLLATFSQIVPSLQGTFICDELEIPHLSMLVDPVAYSLKLTGSAYSLISCVDRFDCQWLRQSQFQNVFFLPHAVEPELATDYPSDRPYDITFIGSCYDHELLRASWSEKYPPDVCALMDEAAEMILTESSTPIVQAVFSVWAENGRDPREINLVEICFDVDYYVRGKDRQALINAFPKHTVHVFGEVQWATTEGARDWDQQFKSDGNIVVHPPVTYTDSFEVLKQSKICLNSSPFFKDGTHERIFVGMACGCAVVTNRNVFMEEAFTDGEDVLLYDHDMLEFVEARLGSLPLEDLASRGRKKVLENHTWDQRAETILAQVPPMLQDH